MLNLLLPLPLLYLPDYDTLGTIIANMSVADRNAGNMSASELGCLFHLVVPDVDEVDGTAGTKIMSEVFLTRLLSTKVGGL